MPLTEATLRNGAMYLIRKTADEFFGTANDAIELGGHGWMQSVRALPARPGELLLWSAHVLHWGAEVVPLPEGATPAELPLAEEPEAPEEEGDATTAGLPRWLAARRGTCRGDADDTERLALAYEFHRGDCAACLPPDNVPALPAGAYPSWLLRLSLLKLQLQHYAHIREATAEKVDRWLELVPQAPLHVDYVEGF